MRSTSKFNIKLTFMGFLDVIGLPLMAISAASSLIAGERANKSNERINEANLEATQYQNALSRQFSHDEAEIARQYNSPANQMRLYRAAGLNPYLADSNSAEGSQPAASSPAALGIPAPLPMQKVDPVEGILRAAQIDNLGAQSANSSADAFTKFVESIPTLAKYLGADAVREMMAEFLPQIVHNNYDSSQVSRMAEREILGADIRNGISQIELNVQQKYGKETAYRKLLNLEQDAVESVTRTGLYNSLAKLNESNVEANFVKMKEMVSSAYRNFAEAHRAEALAMTEDELRYWYKAQAMVNYLEKYYPVSEMEASFEENELVRAFQKSDQGKANAKFNYILDNNAAGNAASRTVNFVGRVLDAGIGGKSLFSAGSSAVAPWQTGFVRRSENYMNARGYKGKAEWYAPLEP